MSDPTEDRMEARLERIESRLAIGQLPIRYAMAIDSRDVQSWVGLFVPDVHVTKEATGREALAEQISGMLSTFYRSVHQICGQRIDLDDADDDHATGAVYCRAEHEVGGRWIVMAICYFDDYRRIDGEWLFKSRRERHWYAADINEHPQDVGFDSWGNGRPPALPAQWPTWSQFWAGNTLIGVEASTTEEQR
jgi:SnoaL-like domain